ncbi:MAG: hypothetical protein ABF811_02135 [Pseudoclavibacter sp.]
MSAIQQPSRPRRAQPRAERAQLRRLLEAVSEQIDALDDASITGRDVDDLAQRMVAVIPRRSPWNDVLGPFHSTRGVADLLGVSRQAVAKRVRTGSLVRVVTETGESLFPAFQLRSGRPLPGLLPVVRALRAGTDDEYAIAQWLAAPDPSTRRSPADLLAAGRTDEVLRTATRTAAAWAA